MWQTTTKHPRKNWKPYKLKEEEKKFWERGLKCGKYIFKQWCERQRPTEADAQWFVDNLMNEEIKR